MKNADMPAMPIYDANGGVFDFVLECSGGIGRTTGMTKREMIAMHCAAALFSNSSYKGMPELVAERAVAQADALLDELKKYG